MDAGLTDSNLRAAPLHEVAPLGAFALDEQGAVLGGAVGRRWGHCCELQQLWVHPAHRRRGLATALLEEFERRACEHGCTLIFLETFTFQAPEFYRRRGFVVSHEQRTYPHRIGRLHMVKHIGKAAG